MKNIKLIFISIVIFTFYYFFPYLISFIVDLLNLDLSSWNYILKYIFIYSLDLIPLIILLVIYKKDLIRDWKNFKSNWKKYAEDYIKFWILGIVFMSFSNSIIAVFTSNAVGNNEELVRQITDSLPVYSVITTCLFAPLIEELAYRKTLKNIFNIKWLSILASGLIFGAAHVIGTYETLTDWLYIIPYGALGSIFMYIYYDSDNIWTTISLHFIHNSILMAVYLASNLL